MASLRVLTFDHKGHTPQFDTWLNDLQLYLLSDSRDSVSLFDHTSGVAPAPPATADSATCSLWLTREAAACLAIRNHLPLAECAHFGQHRTAQTLYDAVVARYTSPATAALGRLLLPYLFPELSAFATVEDLVSHLRASDARYHAAASAEVLDRIQPSVFITLYFIVTRLPDSLCSDRYHFLYLDHFLFAVETSAVAALHTFTLDSGASRCFFRDSTTLTPLPAPVPVRLADPSGGPVVARSSSVLPCPAVPSGSLSGLHLPSFSTNLVSNAALQDAMVTTTTPGGQRVSICTCTRTGRHLATFTRRPRSSLYTLATEPPHVAVSAQVSASGQVAPPCSCRLLSHQTLLWHHRLGHPSLPRLHGMHSRLLCAAPHSSSFPPMTAPLQTLHIDVKGEVPDVLIPWIHAVCLQLRERFSQDIPVLRLHSDRGGKFSSDLLRDFCCGEGILQSFTLPASPQQNGIAECHIGLVMEDSCAFVCDTSTDNLSAHAIPCVFLGFPPNAPGWQFYHPTSRRVLPSQDVTFDESVPFYHPLPGRALVEVAIGSGAAQGVATRGAASGGAEPGGAESEGAGSGGAELGGEEPGGAEPRGTASSRGPPGASSGLSLLQLREWLVRLACLRRGATGAGCTGDVEARGTGVTAGAGGTGGAAAAGPGGARTRGTEAARTCGVGGTGAGDPTEPGAAGAGGSGARVGGAGAGGTGAGGAGAAGAGGPVQPRPYFSQPPLLSISTLPAPSPYTEQSGGLTERREPASCSVSPVRPTRRVPRSRPPPVPGTHTIVLRPSTVPLRVPLPAPPESSLPEVPHRESDRARAASPTVSRLLATAVTDPSFESSAASALVAELLDFATACCLDYATALVAESESASPPSVGGECALGTDVLEDRQEDFECLAAAVPCFASMLIAPEGDPDAPDIQTPRSYADAITGPYSSQWQAAMDAEMASWKSTGTYVDEVPPPGANIVDGIWIFRVKRPLGSPPPFKARYVARGFSQRQGVDYFQTFSPTPKMTTLRVLLHVAAQHDYELHSQDFSTAFLQGSLHEEIWLRHPPSITGTTLTALGCAPSTADPSLFLRTDTSFYVLVYIDDLLFATADTEALALVKSELIKRHTCTDLGPLALLLATAHSSVYRPLALSSTFE
ncbi:unnamed protein product [Closterium sp. NIES-53]